MAAIDNYYRYSRTAQALENTDPVLNSHTAQALKAGKASGFDALFAETAQKYSRTGSANGRDSVLAFTAPQRTGLDTLLADVSRIFSQSAENSSRYDPVLRRGEA